MKAGDFIVYGPGGPGEDASLECPSNQCRWSTSLRFEHDLDELLSMAEDHIAAVH